MNDLSLRPNPSPSNHPKPVFHRPELDVLRCIAFLLVFVHHGLGMTRQFQHGILDSEWFLLVRAPTGYGLSLFFVLSAYLITEIVLREKEFTGTINIKAFYVRRILRIWPLYACFLLFCFTLGRVFPALRISLSFFLDYAFLLGNYAFYHIITGNPINILWSISVEEQFYLCWPFFAWKFDRKGLVRLCLAIIAASIGCSVWLTAHALHPGFAIWTNSVTQFGCFAAGALLAIALHGKAWTPSHMQRVGFVLTWILSWAVSDGVFHFKRNEWMADRQIVSHVFGFQLAIVGCCFLFVAMLSLPLGRWAKPFIYLGRISYGLYVFHMLALLAITQLAIRMGAERSVSGNRLSLLIMGCSLSVSCLCAVASYHLFEKRFIRLKARFAIVRT